MARPRKPGDPSVWPDPCARCREHYKPVARWPDGRICGYCYQAAKRERGTCACGHVGVLPGRVGGRPACRTCSGVRLNVDCVACGAEAELYRGGRCLHCELSLVVDGLLTDPNTGKVAPELVAISEAMKNMKRANSGLTWIKQTHVRSLFEQLRGHGQITHELLDSLPRRVRGTTCAASWSSTVRSRATISTASASTNGPRAPSSASTIAMTVMPSRASSAGTSFAG